MTLPKTVVEDANVKQSKNEPQDVKIIFLDVDGVLNCFTTTSDILCDDLILNLFLILQKTNAKIVLSSSWRRTENAKQQLFDRMKKVTQENMKIFNGWMFDKNAIYIGDTDATDIPLMYDFNFGTDRASEINKWLTDNGKYQYNIIGWCAIDDLNLLSINKRQDKYGINDHFVQTDGAYGLTIDDANKVIHILNDVSTNINIKNVCGLKNVNEDEETKEINEIENVVHTKNKSG